MWHIRHPRYIAIFARVTVLQLSVCSLVNARLKLRRYGPKTVTRELAPVSGVTPPVAHHTLLAENHANGGPYRYREFVVFQNAHVYPEYLIAYQRFQGALGPRA